MLWPVLLFSIMAIVNILTPQFRNDRLYGLELAGCAVISLLLAKERPLVFAAGVVAVAIRLGWALLMTRDWRSYGIGFLVTIGLIAVLLSSLRKRKSSYDEPRETNWLGLLCVVAGIIAAAAVIILLKPRT